MINWFKNKIEEVHLKKLLQRALNDSSIKKKVSVGAATFAMRPAQSILPEAGNNQRVLVGTYKEWPIIKRAPADCVLEMGSFHNRKKCSFYAKISIIIFSKRVVGFLFTYGAAHQFLPIDRLTFTSSFNLDQKFTPPEGFPV